MVCGPDAVRKSGGNGVCHPSPIGGRVAAQTTTLAATPRPIGGRVAAQTTTLAATPRPIGGRVAAQTTTLAATPRPIGGRVVAETARVSDARPPSVETLARRCPDAPVAIATVPRARRPSARLANVDKRSLPITAITGTESVNVGRGTRCEVAPRFGRAAAQLGLSDEWPPR
jgi:hypothetical protein